MGTAVIENRESGDIRNVRISLLVEQYMDSPKECARIMTIKKGESVEIPLLALFNDRILSVTEGTKTAAELVIEYDYTGTGMSKTSSATLEIYDRNAMTWDDDRKAASFVTAKDPVILQLSKQIAGEARTAAAEAINLNFRIGLGIFQVLSESGLNYVIDPTTPYSDFSKNGQIIDYLQFPVQTLNYKAGDCDDLSILYAALLKSVGIEAAFITVPGHILLPSGLI